MHRSRKPFRDTPEGEVWSNLFGTEIISNSFQIPKFIFIVFKKIQKFETIPKISKKNDSVTLLLPTTQDHFDALLAFQPLRTEKISGRVGCGTGPGQHPPTPSHRDPELPHPQSPNSEPSKLRNHQSSLSETVRRPCTKWKTIENQRFVNKNEK